MEIRTQSIITPLQDNLLCASEMNNMNMVNSLSKEILGGIFKRAVSFGNRFDRLTFTDFQLVVLKMGIIEEQVVPWLDSISNFHFFYLEPIK